ncbi:hypothetical protein WJX72_009528 [[Myrmecia] bisecta]|uniref:Hemimethylated DNA-binding domain-containing protein n=1 Tax=[Myrmecia] bisecta TaxID=41462 RepID=A0AAW1P8L3_9CHLO
MDIYAQRLQIEQEAAELVAGMVWPLKRNDCILQLRQMQEEGLEYLRTAVHPGPMNLGTRYWSDTALSRLQSSRCAELIQGLLARPGYAEEHVEEGALLLAQLAYPRADLRPIVSYLDELGGELKRRLAAAGVAGGRRALETLNCLLFGPMAPEQHTAYEDVMLEFQSTGPSGASDWTWTQAEARHLVIPPDGYGLALKGDARSYYDRSNSLLPYVLVHKKGIPISLAVVHAAVGRRAGLPIGMVSVPMHFMNRLGEEGGADECFVDVFDGGRIASRKETVRHMQSLNVGISPAHLRSIDPEAVYCRMCANLINIHRQQRNYVALRQILDLMLGIRPASHDYRIMRAQVEMECGDWDAAIGDLLPLMPNNASVDVPVVIRTNATLLMEAAERLKVENEEDVQKQFPRSARSVRYHVGQVIQHKRYHYRGVIYDWDPTCRATPEWIEQMGVARLSQGAGQPFYNVLVDMRDRPFQSTYVAQENITLPRGPWLQAYADVLVLGNAGGAASTAGAVGAAGMAGAAGAAADGLPEDMARAEGSSDAGVAGRQHGGSNEVEHPEVGEYFEGLPSGGMRYQPNAYLRFRYPEG